MVAIASLAAFAAQAQAATFSVGTTSDLPGICGNPAAGTCSLRQLISYEDSLTTTPSPPDTIVVPAGSYDLTNGPLVIDQSVTIAGAGARTTQILQETRSATSRVFDIQKNLKPSLTPTVVISGLATAFGKADITNGFFGGDIRNQGILTLSEDLIEEGSTTSGSGDGISNDGGTLRLTHSLVELNSSTNPTGGGDSGGIQNYGDTTVGAGHLVVDNSTIVDNTAALGGGIFSWCGPPNGACSAVGATNTTTITNSTIAFNDGGTRTDERNAGGLLANQGTISVENSIVASNTVDTPATGTASNCGSTRPGAITSLGHNLETGTDCGFSTTGDLQSANPHFTSSTPQNNGGNTNTLGLAPASPAVDAILPGTTGCSGTDERDVTRPEGQGCDIGAYEYLPTIQAIEGNRFSGPLAAIKSCFVTGATIDWGDGTQSAGTFDTTHSIVSGAHTYAEEGNYAVSVAYTGDCATHTYALEAQVADAPLNAAADSLSAAAGKPFSAPVAAFTDADPGAAATDYAATINWGDGTSSAGSVAAGSSGFVVNGTHTYASTGSYQTTISITDTGGANTAARGTATVSSSPGQVLTGPPAPVFTGPPFVTSSTGAAFSGSVNPEGLETTAFFEYGLDSKYLGASDPGARAAGDAPVYSQSTPAQAVGSDFSTHTVSASVSGLVPNAMYHVRLVASNSAGTTFGPDVTFMTKKDPPPNPPVLGKSFDVSLVSGVVLIKLDNRFVPLTELRQIPTGSQVDALRGTLKLTAATGKKHKTQTGTFGGAIFTLTQATRGATKGLTTVALVEGAFKGAPSYATCSKHASTDARAARLSSRTLQLLHASAHGKFRTRGRYSAATVRGTVWSIADRCDGTLVHVTRDSVVVNDFVRHITLILHPGQSYLAKARG